MFFSYEVMLHCWCENDEDRPSFSELRQRFDKFVSLYIQENHPYIEIPVSDVVYTGSYSIIII